MTHHRILALLSVSLLVLGCSPTPDGVVLRDAGPPDDGGPGQTPDAASDAGDAGDATLALVPLLPEAVDCRAPGAAGRLADGDQLHRVDLDLERFPDALCNDGSGARIFVRAATDMESRDRWLIYLQGGGSCSSPEGCLDRWCSAGTNFGAAKMSIDDAPAVATTAGGIQSRRADNPFANWNQVLVYYCSSDLWAGTARDVVVEGAHPETSEPVEYRIHFLGQRIFDAAIETLRREAGPVMFPGTDGMPRSLPDLDDATRVVLSGSSAGSGGARNQLDRLTETLRRNNVACGGGTCPLEVRGALDAALTPDLERLEFRDSALCAERSICSYEELIRDRYEQTLVGLHGATFDESCVVWHRDHAPGTQWQCGDLGHVMRHHLTTPFFVRQDQADPLVAPNTATMRLTVPRRGGALLDEQMFGQLVSEEMAELPTTVAGGHEGGSVSIPPGTFSPRCGDHTTFRSNGPTFDDRIDAAGERRNMVEVYEAWDRGEAPSQATATSSATFECP